MQVLYAALQACAWLMLAPLLAGITKKVKAWLQNRQGAGIFQVYFDIYKWWNKQICLPVMASVIFIFAPLLFFTTTFIAAMLLPSPWYSWPGGDVLVLLYFLAAGRFAMTLGAMDTATTFGGMGASREVYIATLIEPVMLLSILDICKLSGSTMLTALLNFSYSHSLTLSSALAAIGFFMLMLAENGRIPVDNPDTHLELTMVHEGMTLEYSGRLLSFIHWAAFTKQLIFYVLFSMLFFVGSFPLFIKVFITAVLVAVAESLNNKIRLFRIPNYIIIAAILIILSLVAQ